MSPSILGYTLLLLAQMMVAAFIVVSKLLLQSMPTAEILVFRFSIAFLILLVLHVTLSKKDFAALKRLNRIDWSFIIVQALCAGVLFNILLVMGLKLTDAGTAGIITGALPAVIAVLSILCLRERFTCSTFTCIVLAVLGLFVSHLHGLHAKHTNSFTENHHILGIFLILLALLPEAFYYILSKLRAGKLPVFLNAALMNGINIPFMLLFAWWQRQHFVINLSVAQAAFLLTVGMSSGFFYVFWLLGSKRIQGIMAGLTTAFMPVATILLATIFLREPVTIWQLVGMTLVILSICTGVVAKYNVLPRRIRNIQHSNRHQSNKTQ